MQPNHHILTVSELNAEVNLLLTQSFPLIWLEGEISNLARPASGHFYFSLKDTKAQVRCAMFRNNAMRCRFKPDNGKKILVRARISVYEPRGEYQLIVEHMEDAGEGQLQRKYEQLKKKLASKGWFDEKHKKSFPAYPKNIGIITSPSGAAVQDILNILKRRCPQIPVYLYPVAVQGEQSAPQLVQAIRQASSDKKCDVLIITRGGGSIEDLWSFNEEAVAKAIYNCKVPIISGVGHEIDFTIADFVADQRAPTPSAAAELISPNTDELIQTVDRLAMRLEQAIQQDLSAKEKQLTWLSSRLQQTNPDKKLQQQQSDLQSLQQRLRQITQMQINNAHYQLDKQSIRLNALSPEKHLQEKQNQLTHLHNKLIDQHLQIQKQKQYQFSLLMTRLNSVSPLATLERGYSITQDAKTGAVIHSADKVQAGQAIQTQLYNSKFTSIVGEKT